VQVTPVNDAPAAAADAFTITKNSGPQTLNLLANDHDQFDAGSSIRIVSFGTASQGGTLQILDNGQRVQYTPAANATGSETFSYTIEDSSGMQATGQVTIEIRNFVPSSASGFVYFDVNNNGTKEVSELPIGGVTVTLQGTDDFGEAVNRTAITDAAGAYAFTDLSPGRYTLTQQQPALLVDGRSTAGSQGATAGTNQLSFTLAENTTGTGNNFGERGREAAMVSILDALASTRRARTLAAVSPQNETQWYTYAGPSSASYTPAGLRVNHDGQQVELLAQRNGSQLVSATLPAHDTAQVSKIGSPQSVFLYSVQGELDGLDFQPSTQTGSGTLSLTAPPASAEVTVPSHSPPSSSAAVSHADAAPAPAPPIDLASVAAATEAVKQSVTPATHPLLAALSSRGSRRNAAAAGSPAAVDAALSGLF
jgi:hypothetical protein